MIICHDSLLSNLAYYDASQFWNMYSCSLAARVQIGAYIFLVHFWFFVPSYLRSPFILYYACMHARMHARVYVCMYVCLVCMCVCVCACMLCMHVCMYVCMYVCVRACVCVLVYIYARALQIRLIMMVFVAVPIRSYVIM